MLATTIHTAKRSPKPISGVQDRMMNGAMAAEITVTPSAHFNWRINSIVGAPRHRVIGPTPIKNNAGVIIGINTASK